MKPTSLLLTALCLATAPSLVAESFYSVPSFFSQRPDETKSLTTIDRFGPVGMAIDLIQPAFTMRIKSIEEGSPAAATGKLKAGQIIESINGAPLKDIDPRIQLGNMITAAEAADGVLKFAIKGEAEPVIVKIPVLGAYSPTWPLKCPKSDKIVRGLADYIASPKGEKGIGDIGMIFLMSTGEEKDAAAVGEWARSMKPQRPDGPMGALLPPKSPSTRQWPASVSSSEVTVTTARKGEPSGRTIWASSTLVGSVRIASPYAVPKVPSTSADTWYSGMSTSASGMWNCARPEGSAVPVAKPGPPCTRAPGVVRTV